ncbi:MULTISPECIES: aminotransferase class V-fold PLP-dependent enzyme [Erysipelotrichaceae]|uniref:aminotransferase class V-fold PLP-dependent enzyme n=1 Tax=Erysipelotrichaceae TaxID=128827 RepID=UPI000E4B92B1|nr:cysteine desulfurase [Absiella sp. AM27-20]RHU01198.1 cysteine desulfurase [Absiella sp. AM27-20]
MRNIEEVRKDFPMLQGKMMQQHPLVYLDNGATTLRPRSVIDAVCNYYENYSTNAHRGDYDLSYFVDQEFEGTRQVVADFIHADVNEIVYTSGASEGLNTVAFGYGRKFLSEGDIILSSEAEHASCVLPWMKVAQETGAVMEYIPLDEEGRITVENIEYMMNDNVKVIALAQITNVLGNLVPIKEICALAHRYGAIVVVDGAQSVPHIPVDVKDLDCDFLAFSAHKMCGPTGIGVLYGKYELLEAMDPLLYGGESNARFNACGDVLLKDAPLKFESGTQPIEGVFGLHAAIDYINALGKENIHAYEKQLRDYAVSEMKKMDHIIIYNENNDTGIITFNVKGVFAQDVGSFFNANGIAVRTGQHCAKLLNEVLGTSATVRASLYFYTSKEDIDRFLDVCRKATMEACIDVFF